jgi:hypothetical protein
MLVSALRVVPKDSYFEFQPEEQCIRDAFDSLFDFFHKLASFQRNKLLEFEDFTYFYYWFGMINHISYYKEKGDLPKQESLLLEKRIHEYIVEYGFLGVPELLAEHKKRYPNPMRLG